MCSHFYKSIIEDEINVFNIKTDSLKVAIGELRKTYGPKALKNGTTYIDYNVPSNHCAYLFKFANIHTSLDHKYFLSMISTEQVESVLKKKEHFKICCLGGGPGIDLVGLFEAMASNPHYHKKVTEVTVLDICGGWRNSFNRVIAKLISGKTKKLCSTFIDNDNFKYRLVQVDLLKTLPPQITSILSDADIVCMVKFISAVSGQSLFISAMQNLGSHFKEDAVVLFIDNFNGNVFQPLIEIAGHVGLEVIDEPLHETFNPKTGYKVRQITAAEKEMFGAFPLYSTKVSALALIKSANSSKRIKLKYETAPNTINIVNELSKRKKDNVDATKIKCPVPKPLTGTMRERATQTELSPLSEDSEVETDILNRLGLLFDSLGNLVNVLNQWHQKQITQNQCHCHCHS